MVAADAAAEGSTSCNWRQPMVYTADTPEPENFSHSAGSLLEELVVESIVVEGVTAGAATVSSCTGSSPSHEDARAGAASVKSSVPRRRGKPRLAEVLGEESAAAANAWVPSSRDSVQRILDGTGWPGLTAGGALERMAIEGLKPCGRNPNSGSRSSNTGYMGVSRDVARQAVKKFRAQYTMHGMQKHLGVYDNPEAAALAYLRFASQVEQDPLPVTVPLAVAAPPPAPVWAVPVASPRELPVTVPLARALRDPDGHTGDLRNI